MFVSSAESDNTVVVSMALAAMRVVVAKQAEFNEAIQESPEREVDTETSERVDELVEQSGDSSFSSFSSFSSSNDQPPPSDDRGANLDIEV